MNTATLGGQASRPVFPTGVPGLAVRAGRALESWGAQRASARPTRDELAQLIALRGEARRAVADNAETMRRAGLPPVS